jgi:hypothetical protein
MPNPLPQVLELVGPPSPKRDGDVEDVAVDASGVRRREGEGRSGRDERGLNDDVSAPHFDNAIEVDGVDVLMVPYHIAHLVDVLGFRQPPPGCPDRANTNGLTFAPPGRVGLGRGWWRRRRR